MTSSDIHGRREPAPFTTEQLASPLDQFATAQTVTDVNIAAGIALNKVLGIDD
jgi:hypothetical protein